MANWMSMGEAAASVPTGARIYLAGATSEPTALLDAVEPGMWRDVTVTGGFVPGINDRDYRRIGDRTRVEAAMLTKGLNDGDRIAQLPLSYTNFRRHLLGPGQVDLAFTQVAPPTGGVISLGLTADFIPAIAQSGARLIGIVNALMPVPMDGISLPLERFTALVDHAAPLATYDAGQPGLDAVAIGQTIAGLIDDGDTVELGIGRLQPAILDALRGRKCLGFHAGMIAGAMAPHLENDVFDLGVTAGVALGDLAFYDLVAGHDRVRFRDVETTHGIASLAAIPRVVAVNSVIEIDLFGQANAETVDGRPIAGQGGLADFVRGARASTGGRSILALPSTAKRGSVSRILPHLPAGTPVTLPRSDADLVVTEHGVADLRNASVDQRAERLIAVAAPTFRPHLSDAWEIWHSRSGER